MKLNNSLDRKKLKELIKESPFSMRELSMRARVSESYVKDLANGRLVSPTLDKFIRVCKALNISAYILAPDLQKPTIGNIDESVLEKAIMEVLDTAKSVKNLSVKQKAQLVISRYKQILGNEKK